MAQFDVTAVFKISGFADINRAFKDISSAAGDTNRRLQQFGSNAGQFATRLAGIGTAVGASLAGAAARFGEFERDFTAVVTLLDDSSFTNLPLEQGIDGLTRS